ncbi:MAG: isoamylase early set domain-containing protein [Nitrospirota bacterium]
MKKKIAKKSAPEVKTVRKAKKQVSIAENDNGLKKEYLKSTPICNVTFTLPREAVQNARKVTLVGDFNNWSKNATPMKKLKTGDFRLKVKLARKRHYKFRYLVDSKRWENDWKADNYVPNVFGDDDSVVIVK